MRTELVLSRNELRMVFASLAPHMLRDPKPNEVDRGVGLLRFRQVKETFAATVVAKEGTRTCVAFCPLVEWDAIAAPLADIWVGLASVKAIVSMLELSGQAQVLLVVEDRSIEVSEIGSLWGGRRIRVPRLLEPTAEDRIDPAPILRAAASANRLADCAVYLQGNDVRAFEKSVKEMNCELFLRAGIVNEGLSFVWGSRVIIPGKVSFVGVSCGMRVPKGVGLRDEMCLSGEWVDIFMGLDLDPPSEEEATAEAWNSIGDWDAGVSEEMGE